jgi:hypothetical protein
MELLELKSLCSLRAVLLDSLAMSRLTETMGERISSAEDRAFVFGLVGTGVATVFVVAAIYISALLVARGLGLFGSAAS